MLEDLMGQMQQAQKEMNEAKKRLDSVSVEAQAEGGMVKVVANGNKKILNISISDELMDDKEAVEDLVLVAINRAIEKADNVFESEMGSLAQGFMPNLPGM